ncbi:rRNA maturation RNase YbeY [Algoriphagus confluentis]|uniref:Endoribonuclease YbeY n=1 Tax=Algoriphagus confluentis TaxID=1697556 RepID=A0ABQ6PQB3_9BACT|nr:rRNA maturation RNase YbeY [Algoriphagus confluentis]
MAIQFFTEDIEFNLPDKRKRKAWLKTLANAEDFKIGDLNYIFCSDEHLYQINLEYLKHKTYTDIITFDNSEQKELIEGDIFISIERIRENAQKEKVSETDELSRVISHGLFHLMGYQDKTKKQAEEMRIQENQAIDLFKNL